MYVSNLGGSTTLLNETEPGWGLFAEGIMTVLVVLTVLMTTLDEHDEHHLSPFAIGFSILVGVTAGYVTNSSYTLQVITRTPLVGQTDKVCMSERAKIRRSENNLIYMQCM